MKYDTSISVIDFIYYTVGFKQGKKLVLFHWRFNCLQRKN